LIASNLLLVELAHQTYHVEVPCCIQRIPYNYVVVMGNQIVHIFKLLTLSQ